MLFMPQSFAGGVTPYIGRAPRSLNPRRPGSAMMPRARVRARLLAAVVDARRDQLRPGVLRRHDLDNEALARQLAECHAREVLALQRQAPLAVHEHDHLDHARSERVVELEAELARVHTALLRRGG